MGENKSFIQTRRRRCVTLLKTYLHISDDDNCTLLSEYRELIRSEQPWLHSDDISWLRRNDVSQLERPDWICLLKTVRWLEAAAVLLGRGEWNRERSLSWVCLGGGLSIGQYSEKKLKWDPLHPTEGRLLSVNSRFPPGEQIVLIDGTWSSLCNQPQNKKNTSVC